MKRNCKLDCRVQVPLVWWHLGLIIQTKHCALTAISLIFMIFLIFLNLRRWSRRLSRRLQGGVVWIRCLGSGRFRALRWIPCDNIAGSWFLAGLGTYCSPQSHSMRRQARGKTMISFATSASQSLFLHVAFGRSADSGPHSVVVVVVVGIP